MVQLQPVNVPAFYPLSIITSHSPSSKRQSFQETHVLLLFNDGKTGAPFNLDSATDFIQSLLQ